jgi:hypothetical protein
MALATVETSNRHGLVLGLAWKLLFQGPDLDAQLRKAADAGRTVAGRLERAGVVAAGWVDATDATALAAAGRRWQAGALCAARWLSQVHRSDSGVLLARLADGRYWLCAIRDGFPAPGQDGVFPGATDPELLRQIGALAGSGPWAVAGELDAGLAERIPPATATPFTWAELARQGGGATALALGARATPGWAWPAGLAAVLLLGLGVAWLRWPDPMPPPIPFMPRKTPEELAALRAAAQQAAIRQALAGTLAGPSLREAAGACLDRLWATPLWIGDQPVQAWQCDGRALTARYTRPAGSPVLIQAYHGAFGDTAVPDPAARTFAGTAPLPVPPPALAARITAITALPAKTTVYDRLLTLGQVIESPSFGGLGWTLTAPVDVAIRYNGPNSDGEMTQPETVPPAEGYATGTVRLHFPGLALVRPLLERLAAAAPVLVFQSFTATPSAGRSFDVGVTVEATYVVH